MLEMNQTPGNDKDLITVIRINMDSSGYLYFSDANDKITLDGIDFDGKVILQDSVSDIEKGCNCINGGTIGQVGNFSFSLARYNSYTGTSNFFNDFYPNTSKPLLTSKTVEIGVCWIGATTLAEITWIGETYYIEDYSWKVNSIDLFCVGDDELSATQIPYYTLHIKEPNKFDDGISYYTDLDEEDEGVTIPIIYGDLHASNVITESNLLAPVVKVSKDNKFKLCSHKAHTVEEIAYQYSASANAYISVSADSITLDNTKAGASLEFVNNSANLLYGSAWILIKPKNIISAVNVTDKNNAFDNNNDTYAILTPDATFGTSLDIKLNSVNSDTVGSNEANAGDIKVMVKYKTTNSGDTLRLSTAPTILSTSYTPNNTNINDAEFEIGTIDINELSSQTIYIGSIDTNVGDIYIYNVYILMPNQLVYALDYEIGKLYIKNKLVSTKRWLYGANYPANSMKKGDFEIIKQTIETQAVINNTQTYCAVKGYVYDSWID